MIKILETPRLLLRECTLSDAAFVLELMNTPQWLRFIGDRGVHTLEDARLYLQGRTIRSYRDNGFGFYLVALKDKENLPIGMCGLAKRDGLEDVDIGFAFLPEYAGQGYGYEAASAIMSFAQERLGLSRIVAITVPENKVSIKLLQKIGLSHEKMIRLQGDDTELMLFSINL